MRFGVKIGQWGWRYDELVAGWVAAEQAGFALVSCWDHAVAAPAGLAAWDAPSLLTAMAGATRQVRLGTHMINTALRHPFLLAAQLAVAQAASGGRIEAGLGVGGATHLAGHVHRALGVPLPPFADRLRRLEACLRIFPALWRGETVDEPVLACVPPAWGH
jgi:alkanesulfonate monooxygenase SsuD/methylene tetrahydromethanopterin reductase-like flavin-dependent oxidoreductase (luciferase family)